MRIRLGFHAFVVTWTSD